MITIYLGVLVVGVLAVVMLLLKEKKGTELQPADLLQNIDVDSSTESDSSLLSRLHEHAPKKSPKMTPEAISAQEASETLSAKNTQEDQSKIKELQNQAERDDVRIKKLQGDLDISAREIRRAQEHISDVEKQLKEKIQLLEIKEKKIQELSLKANPVKEPEPDPREESTIPQENISADQAIKDSETEENENPQDQEQNQEQQEQEEEESVLHLEKSLDTLSSQEPEATPETEPESVPEAIPDPEPEPEPEQESKSQEENISVIQVINHCEPEENVDSQEPDAETPKLRLDDIDALTTEESQPETDTEKIEEEQTSHLPEAGEISLSSPEDESGEIKFGSESADSIAPKEHQEYSEPKNNKNPENSENPSP